MEDNLATPSKYGADDIDGCSGCRARAEGLSHVGDVVVVAAYRYGLNSEQRERREHLLGAYHITDRPFESRRL
jgi:hypothetical protein